jgi:hypothetical protein
VSTELSDLCVHSGIFCNITVKLEYEIYFCEVKVKLTSSLRKVSLSWDMSCGGHTTEKKDIQKEDIIIVFDSNNTNLMTTGTLFLSILSILIMSNQIVNTIMNKMGKLKL